MFPLRQSLAKTGWPQPWSPIQCDNSTVIGVSNETRIPSKINSMDMQLTWLRCRDLQRKFRYFCAPGPDNLVNYSTKNHPPIYHLYQKKTRQISIYCPQLVAVYLFLLTALTTRVRGSKCKLHIPTLTSKHSFSVCDSCNRKNTPLGDTDAYYLA